MVMTTQYEFQRRENKYLIHQALAQQLREECTYNMPGAEVRKYSIRSVYFDNEQWRCFCDQVVKRNPRFKVRFRQYGDSTGTFYPKGFLELKMKSGPYTMKQRFWIRPEWLNELEEPEVMEEIIRLNVGNRNLPAVYQSIMNVIRENVLRPVLEVRYTRLSFEDSEYRITLDSTLRFSALQNQMQHTMSKKDSLDPLFSILEVKTKDEQPEWLTDFRREYGIHKQSFSKYCFGVSLLYDPLKTLSEKKLSTINEMEHINAAA